MATSTKAWDALAARTYALDAFWERQSRRCQRREIVTISFEGFKRQTLSDDFPEGIPLDDVRPSISGENRVGLVNGYGIFWRSVYGTAIQITTRRLTGVSWFVQLAGERARRSAELIALLANAACIGASTSERASLGKIVNRAEELEGAVSGHQTAFGKLLPPVEPADVSDADADSDDD